MNKLKVSLKNCYGINQLDHEFDFSRHNTQLVYAPNGVMKTSFAKTLRRVSEGKEPEEKLFDKQPEYEILVDDRYIEPEEILVLKRYDPDYEGSNVSTLLVEPQRKARYDAALKEIITSKKKLVATMKKLSGIKLDDVETNILNDLNVDNIFEAIEWLKTNRLGDAGLSSVPHNVIFDPKVIGLLKHKDLKDSIEEYSQRYNELLQKSEIYNHGSFTPANALTVTKALDKENFFDANHQLLLNEVKDPIRSADELSHLITDHNNKILGDGKLKEISDKISSGVAALKTFQNILASHPMLAAELIDLENFRKKLWASYYSVESESFNALLDIYQKKKDELVEIESEADIESTDWHSIKNEFESRFHVPFKVDIEDQKNAILGTKAPNIVFKFEDPDSGRLKVLKHGNIKSLDMLSEGERRAMYLLYFIFEIQTRMKSENPTLVVVDDIADSFDYKNKYAIVEYLKDIADNGVFSLIVLTHNFDFFRTFQGRIQTEKFKRDNSFIAQKELESIRLLSGGENTFVDPFDKWRTDHSSSSTKIVAMIPFIRNLVQYKEGGKTANYSDLTAMLHIKDGSNQLRLGHLEAIFRTVLNNSEISQYFDVDTLVVDFIHATANEVAGDMQSDTVTIDNKIVLSISIRLLAEKYLWSEIKNNSSIKKRNQTAELIGRYLSENQGADAEKDKVKSLLGQVNLMTPENIHLNSFMFEPLIDMSNHHLSKLHRKLKILIESGEVVDDS